MRYLSHLKREHPENRKFCTREMLVLGNELLPDDLTLNVNTSGLPSSTFGGKSEGEASKQTKNFPVTVRSSLVKASQALKLQICYCDDKSFALQSFAASREIMGYVTTLIH